MNQVETYNLPPNPAKLTDTRCKKYISRFGNESWELDALEPSILTQLINDNVLCFRDEKKYLDICQAELAYKSDLDLLLRNYDDAINFLKKGQ